MSANRFAGHWGQEEGGQVPAIGAGIALASFAVFPMGCPQPSWQAQLYQAALAHAQAQVAPPPTAMDLALAVSAN